MYETIPIIGIIVLIMLGLLILVVAVAMKRRKEGKYPEPDYRAFFVLGICLLPMGVVFVTAINNPGFIGFIGLGAFFMILGLANRDKWKKR